MKEIKPLELTLEELTQFLNNLREDVIVTIIFDTEGGDNDDGRKEVQA